VNSYKAVDKNFNGQRAHILCSLGRINEAVKASHEELKLQPDHRRSKAIIRLARHRPDNTQLYSEKLARELFKTGMKYLSQGDAVEAIRHFEEAAADCVTIPDLHYAMATAYTQLGNISSAVKACRTELSYQPEHHGVVRLLGQIKNAVAAYDKLQGSSTENKPNL
jgi:tetratricopeptide (TPR) repeat protein